MEISSTNPIAAMLVPTEYTPYAGNKMINARPKYKVLL
ncbi:MAG: hypothetical protein ACJAWL_001353 [Motiliproteus sp.]|jgi:hypothetical protein